VKTLTLRIPEVEAAMLLEVQKTNKSFRDLQGLLLGLIPPLSGKLSPLDLKTRGLEDMTNASLQRSRQS
jgi:hypothetical protein